MPVNRGVVIGGVVIGGAGIAYYLYKKSKTTAATAGASTGYGYGYGYGSQPGYYGYGYGYGSEAGFGGGYGGAVSGGVAPVGYGYGYGSGGGGSSVTSNSQWLTEATGMLEAEGYSAGTVQAALGAYLAGASLTSDQQSVVSAAIAAAGYPPQSGASGYPPAMNTSAQSGQTTGGSTPAQPGGGTTSAKAGPISNLQQVSTSKNSFTVRWNPVKGASGYEWTVTNTKTGAHVASAPAGGQTGTSATINGLQSKVTYNFGVQALPGGPGNNIHITTK